MPLLVQYVEYTNILSRHVNIVCLFSYLFIYLFAQIQLHRWSKHEIVINVQCTHSNLWPFQMVKLSWFYYFTCTWISVKWYDPKYEEMMCVDQNWNSHNKLHAKQCHRREGIFAFNVFTQLSLANFPIGFLKQPVMLQALSILKRAVRTNTKQKQRSRRLKQKLRLLKTEKRWDL